MQDAVGAELRLAAAAALSLKLLLGVAKEWQEESLAGLPDTCQGTLQSRYFNTLWLVPSLMLSPVSYFSTSNTYVV